MNNPLRRLTIYQRYVITQLSKIVFSIVTLMLFVGFVKGVVALHFSMIGSLALIMFCIQTTRLTTRVAHFERDCFQRTKTHIALGYTAHQIPQYHWAKWYCALITALYFSLLVSGIVLQVLLHDAHMHPMTKFHQGMLTLCLLVFFFFHWSDSKDFWFNPRSRHPITW